MSNRAARTCVMPTSSRQRTVRARTVQGRHHARRRSSSGRGGHKQEYEPHRGNFSEHGHPVADEQLYRSGVLENAAQANELVVPHVTTTLITSVRDIIHDRSMREGHAGLSSAHPEVSLPTHTRNMSQDGVGSNVGDMSSMDVSLDRVMRLNTSAMELVHAGDLVQSHEQLTQALRAVEQTLMYILSDATTGTANTTHNFTSRFANSNTGTDGKHNMRDKVKNNASRANTNSYVYNHDAEEEKKDGHDSNAEARIRAWMLIYAVTLSNLGCQLRREDRCQDALTCLQDARDVELHLLGKPSVSTLLNLSAVLLRVGMRAEALAMAQHCLAEAREPVVRVTALHNLALAMNEQVDAKMREEALPMMQQALREAHMSLGESHPTTAVLQEKYALLSQVRESDFLAGPQCDSVCTDTHVIARESKMTDKTTRQQQEGSRHVVGKAARRRSKTNNRSSSSRAAVAQVERGTGYEAHKAASASSSGNAVTHPLNERGHQLPPLPPPPHTSFTHTNTRSHRQLAAATEAAAAPETHPLREAHGTCPTPSLMRTAPVLGSLRWLSRPGNEEAAESLRRRAREALHVLHRQLPAPSPPWAGAVDETHLTAHAQQPFQETTRPLREHEQQPHERKEAGETHQYHQQRSQSKSIAVNENVSKTDSIVSSIPRLYAEEVVLPVVHAAVLAANNAMADSTSLRHVCSAHASPNTTDFVSPYSLTRGSTNMKKSSVTAENYAPCGPCLPDTILVPSPRTCDEESMAEVHAPSHTVEPRNVNQSELYDYPDSCVTGSVKMWCTPRSARAHLFNLRDTLPAHMAICVADSCHNHTLTASPLQSGGSALAARRRCDALASEAEMHVGHASRPNRQNNLEANKDSTVVTPTTARPHFYITSIERAARVAWQQHEEQLFRCRRDEAAAKEAQEQRVREEGARRVQRAWRKWRYARGKRDLLSQQHDCKDSHTHHASPQHPLHHGAEQSTHAQNVGDAQTGNSCTENDSKTASKWWWRSVQTRQLGHMSSQAVVRMGRSWLAKTACVRYLARMKQTASMCKESATRSDTAQTACFPANSIVSPDVANAHTRGVTASQTTEVKRWSEAGLRQRIVCIQSHWRGYRARRCDRMTAARSHASLSLIATREVMICDVGAGVVTNEWKEKQHAMAHEVCIYAALVIQKALRCYRARQAWAERYREYYGKPAETIQRWWRLTIADQRARGVDEVTVRQRLGAARCIQCAWRCYRARAQTYLQRLRRAIAIDRDNAARMNRSSCSVPGQKKN